MQRGKSLESMRIGMEANRAASQIAASGGPDFVLLLDGTCVASVSWERKWIRNLSSEWAPSEKPAAWQAFDWAEFF
jgi:hypothetical protein